MDYSFLGEFYCFSLYKISVSRNGLFAIVMLHVLGLSLKLDSEIKKKESKFVYESALYLQLKLPRDELNLDMV